MSHGSRPDRFYGGAARRSGGASWLGAGSGRGHSRGAADEAFAYQGDTTGVRRWARERGWTAAPSGADAPPVVREVLDGAPVPLGDEHVATEVWVGTHGGWDVVALDVGMQTVSGVVPKWALTAVGRAQVGDAFVLHPRRLGRFSRPGRGLRAVDAGDAELQARWEAATSGDPRHLVGLLDAEPVRRALLATDDGDEVWGTATAVAAIRPDDHRPALLEHHLAVLTVLADAERGQARSR